MRPFSLRWCELAPLPPPFYRAHCSGALRPRRSRCWAASWAPSATRAQLLPGEL